ncbi:AzlD domain-containing protein [Gammaproteobacteria bacterium]|nr:AzlD domain-containing protein [Gammaproteobacteria bacterium]
MTSAALSVIAIMAIVVYLTRVSGYFLGLRLRHLPGFQTVLEALPGCAFMALLVPATVQGGPREWLAMAAVVGLMWFSNSVALATSVGVLVLVFY